MEERYEYGKQLVMNSTTTTCLSFLGNSDPFVQSHGGFIKFQIPIAVSVSVSVWDTNKQMM